MMSIGGMKTDRGKKTIIIRENPVRKLKQNRLLLDRRV
jgi:hypothetical protein